MVDPAPSLLRFTAPSFTPEAEAEAAVEALATAGDEASDGSTSFGAPSSSDSPAMRELASVDDGTSGQPAPPGARLLAELAEGLRGLGWAVDYQWATYRGHALDARRIKRRYDVEVWLCDPEGARWELSAEPRRGLFRRLFTKAPDPAEVALLRLHLEDALSRLADVRDVSPWQPAGG
jgi:hypothetical protein